MRVAADSHANFQILRVHAAVLGSLFAAGSAVMNSKDAGVRTKGGAGPAYSVVLAAADIAKKARPCPYLHPEKTFQTNLKSAVPK